MIGIKIIVIILFIMMCNIVNADDHSGGLENVARGRAWTAADDLHRPRGDLKEDSFLLDRKYLKDDVQQMFQGDVQHYLKNDVHQYFKIDVQQMFQGYVQQ